MWSDYDENLSDNSFFQELVNNHNDLIEKSSLNSWIICVPRQETVVHTKITTTTILDHILIQNEANSSYFTLNKKEVYVKTHHILCGIEEIQVNFEETFYINNTTQKYTVWCIERPLFSKRIYCSRVCLKSLHDCIDFLWAENGLIALEKIRGLCEKFEDFYPNDLQNQKEMIGNLYSQCLQLMLKLSKIDNERMANVQLFDNLKLSVETYMQYCLDKKLIMAINSCVWENDANFNKIIRNSNDLQLNDLNITKFSNVIYNAKCELNRINNYNTILDKINCIKKTFDIIFNCCKTSDDILQILIFLIIKSNINNWKSNLIYIKQFKFSLFTNKCDQIEFFLTTFDAAFEFIKSEQFAKLKQTNCDKIQLFQLIKNNNLTSFLSQLSNCHPLCICEQCSNLSAIVNEKGQNPLIFASILNRLDFVEYLLTKIDMNSCDYFGRTSLHYVCLSGYQRILLVLIESNIDINIEDNDGNTCLHLAALNGHESCVKALLYTSLVDVNCCNKAGETALHLAVRHSYLEICKILLENGANPTLLNKKSQSSLCLANNHYMVKLLKKFVVIEKFEDFEIISENSYDLSQLKKIELLMKAVRNNDLPLVCFYLGFSQSLPSLNVQMKCHPLCTCEKCDDLPVIEQISSPINVNMCGKEGETALHLAAKYGRTEILRVLLDCCADPNLKMYETLYTALHLACMYQKIQIVRELVKCGGCVVDSCDFKGNTPLFYACINNDKRIVEVLLNNGANWNHKNFEGKSVLAEVQDRMFYGVFKLLKEHDKCDEETDFFNGF